MACIILTVMNTMVDDVIGFGSLSLIVIKAIVVQRKTFDSIVNDLAATNITTSGGYL